MTEALARARETFPATKNLTYLDAAAVSLISQPTYDAIRAFLDLCIQPGSADASRHHMVMDDMRSRAIGEAAILLNVDRDQIALVESTTHGLNIAANAIPLEKGDQILIADTEYLQVSIPWKMKEESAGVEIAPVHSGPNGHLTAGHFEELMSDRTRVVCVSSVQWCSGNRIDLNALGEICRSRDIYLVVDAIQHLGASPLDLQETPVDFLMAGGHKWLNAPFGCGVLYVSPRCVADLKPDSWGYLALEDPEGGWSEYFRRPEISPYSDWQFKNTATKFEIAGTSNYPGAVGLGASLAQINQLGIPTIHQHILGLGEQLRSGLKELGARIISPGEVDEELRSGITIFSIYDSPDGDRALLDSLLDRGIYLAQRYTSGVGGLRASTHFYNNGEDVDRLLNAIEELT
ncbi:MAG: aminotransferase class V-fold PLP-dependent enzyme [Gemmatimonadetes bacterium]|nr:aminotransferase class V-fold PLP-dependent enzyme [Gemmatimonadota bacterium]NNM05409.1 aminotransferase class V-fold PLP-dependent enzyme [Gemmatimonadota bacterium]